MKIDSPLNPANTSLCNRLSTKEALIAILDQPAITYRGTTADNKELLLEVHQNQIRCYHITKTTTLLSSTIPLDATWTPNEVFKKVDRTKRHPPKKPT